MYHKILLILFLFISVSGSSLDPRIVNGVSASANEFSQIVSLRINHKHICGATILNENFLLTAAHCVLFEVSLYSVQYGVTHIIERPYAPNVIKVSRLIPHENYISASRFFGARNDIAVVELATSLKFTANVQPLRLPKASSPVPESRTAVAAGWGLSYTGGPVMENLQKVNLLVYSDSKCENLMHSANRMYHICAGVLQGNKGICNGDSGGPLMVDGTQIGVVSWSTKICALEGYAGVYTRISSYVKWIEEQINSEPPELTWTFSSVVNSIFNYIHDLFF